MRKNRDTYRYRLYHKHQIVYTGISDDPERRAMEHTRAGIRFTSMSVQGPAVTRDSAERWEEDQLAKYRRSHRGRNPRYNKTSK